MELDIVISFIKIIIYVFFYSKFKEEKCEIKGNYRVFRREKMGE